MAKTTELELSIYVEQHHDGYYDTEEFTIITIPTVKAANQLFTKLAIFLAEEIKNYPGCSYFQNAGPLTTSIDIPINDACCININRIKKPDIKEKKQDDENWKAEASLRYAKALQKLGYKKKRKYDDEIEG